MRTRNSGRMEYWNSGLTTPGGWKDGMLEYWNIGTMGDKHIVS
jgi:hypothetical protein